MLVKSLAVRKNLDENKPGIKVKNLNEKKKEKTTKS
jgi:hypothetical protein